MAGFLERLRQDNEARERQAAQEREAREQRWKEAKEDGGAYAETQRKLMKQLQEQTRRHIENSGIDRMTSELVRLLRGGVKDIERTNMEGDPYKGRLGYVIRWDRKYVPGNPVHYTGFEIEVDSTGNVAIKGGFLGSTSLTESQWKGRPDIIESALEKAYNHSKRILEPTNSNESKSRM